MQLLYCDETNLEERAGDFLIYGGLMIGADQARRLSHAIDRLRAEARIPREYRLKFNPGPEGLAHGDFIALKQSVLELCAAFQVRLLTYVILHDIAASPDEARRNGINATCYHFDCILNRLGSAGLVLIDRFNDQGNLIEAHLRDKFSIGITGMPYAGEIRLENIVGFHYSAIGQSHFPSLVDIVLGSLRFAINAHTRGIEAQLGTARQLLNLLSPLFWREVEDQPVPEIGFQFSPKIIRSPRYKARYEELKAFLEDGGVATAQPITDQRRY